MQREINNGRVILPEKIQVTSNKCCNISLFFKHTSFNSYVAMIQSFKKSRQKQRNVWKRRVLITPMCSQQIPALKLLTSHSPLSTALHFHFLLPCHRNPEPPLGCFLLLMCSRHGRSTKIRISAHLESKGRNAGTAYAGMTIQLFVMIFSRGRLSFSEDKQDCVETRW